MILPLSPTLRSDVLRVFVYAGHLHRILKMVNDFGRTGIFRNEPGCRRERTTATLTFFTSDGSSYLGSLSDQRNCSERVERSLMVRSNFDYGKVEAVLV